MDDVTILGKMEKGERLTEKKMDELMQKLYEMNPSNSPESMTFYGTKDEFRNFKRFLGQFAEDNTKKD